MGIAIYVDAQAELDPEEIDALQRRLEAGETVIARVFVQAPDYTGFAMVGPLQHVITRAELRRVAAQQERVRRAIAELT